MAAASDRSIAIVVLTHSRVHLLRQCVEHTLANTSPLTTEIVIWDNASTDETRTFLETLDDQRVRVVNHTDNIGQNAYAEAFKLTSAPYLVELDDDMIAAPSNWDEVLLDAFRRLPDVGFLAADLEDNPHDVAARVRHHERPEAYRPFEVNGIQLLDGPTGGGCAMTSRELYDLVGGFPQQKAKTFFLEDEAYIDRIARLGYRAAVLRNLRVLHAGGPYYAAPTPEKEAYWRRVESRRRRRGAMKRVLLALPFARRLNARFGWFRTPT